VARAAGIHVSQLLRWRKELCSRLQVALMFSAVPVVSEVRASANSAALIEIEFATGTRVRITTSADPSTVRIAIATSASSRRSREPARPPNSRPENHRSVFSYGLRRSSPERVKTVKSSPDAYTRADIPTLLDRSSGDSRTAGG
jgi:hypothetical protein